MKYKILFDYGSEGFKFQDEEFDTVGKAVKHAFDLNFSTRFLIVSVVEWEAVYVEKPEGKKKVSNP